MEQKSGLSSQGKVDQNSESNAEIASKPVALVTGASRGIGAACARALCQNGYQVALHYRSDDHKAAALKEELPHSQLFKFNLADPEACKELIDQVKKQMGGIDVLVNNAGVTADALLPFAKNEDFELLINTNLRPVFLLSKFAAKWMIRKKAGRIINIASVVGVTGNMGQALYSATKGAINSFTRSSALDLAGFGILVNCIAPGFIETDMTAAMPEEAKQKIYEKIPLKRLGKPEDIGKAVVFLSGDASSYITGSTIHVNGGMYMN